jgi:hypothetical protein
MSAWLFRAAMRQMQYVESPLMGIDAAMSIFLIPMQA